MVFDQACVDSVRRLRTLKHFRPACSEQLRRGPGIWGMHKIVICFMSAW